MLKRLTRSPVAQRGASALLAAYLDLAVRSTRWRLDGAEHLAPLLAGRPMVVAFWHERLALSLPLWRHLRAGNRALLPHVLVSRHRDGRMIAGAVARLGGRIVDGSSAGRAQRGGAGAQRALLAALAGGGFACLTPDGPRGPARRAHPGVAQLAALAGVAVLPVSGQSTRRLRLSSWDRTVVPLPFGRGAIVCGAPILVPREGWRAALPAIERGLDAADARADLLCGA